MLSAPHLFTRPATWITWARLGILLQLFIALAFSNLSINQQFAHQQSRAGCGYIMAQPGAAEGRIDTRCIHRRTRAQIPPRIVLTDTTDSLAEYAALVNQSPAAHSVHHDNQLSDCEARRQILALQRFSIQFW
jgi:hypothetical protein